MALVRVVLPDEVTARVERLRGVVRVATRRTALVRELVRLGLEVAEHDPARLLTPPRPMAKGA